MVLLFALRTVDFDCFGQSVIVIWSVVEEFEK